MSLLDTHSGQPARVLGTRDAACVVIGAIIGVGIFFTPSTVARLTGSGSLCLLAWGIGGFIALCGAMAFAELGSRYHDSGAQYRVLRDSYGPFPAYLFVFCNTTAIESGSICIMALLCARYGYVAATGDAVTDAQNLLLLGMATIMILGLSTANALGARWGSRIQNITVYAKVLTLATVTGLAIVLGDWPTRAFEAAPPDSATRTLSPIVAVLAALVPTFYSYGGWQQALWISGEVRDPRRALPRAIIGGVLVVITVYMLVNWAYLHLLGVEGVAGSATVASDAVAAALGQSSPLAEVAPRIVAGAVAISAFGVLNVQFLSAPRLAYAMSRDGKFFSPFGRLSPRYGTPIAAIGLMTVLALLVLFGTGSKGTAGLDWLLNGVMFIDGVFFVLTGAAVIVLRERMKRRPDAEGAGEASYRVPLYPIIPAIFVVGMMGILLGSYVDATLRRAAIIGVGCIVVAALMYAVFFRDQKAGAHADTPVNK
jgi:APA family basic amino acid/polyamine antiporter